MKKVFTTVLITGVLFLICILLHKDSSLTENDVKEIIYVFNNGRIAQKEISSQEITENILIEFYYHNNKNSVLSKNYIVSIEECEQYLSNWFDISTINLSESYYFNSDIEFLDLTGCIDLDSLRTTVTLIDYIYDDSYLEIIFNINYLIGNETNTAQRHIVFNYNKESDNYIFKEVSGIFWPPTFLYFAFK